MMDRNRCLRWSCLCLIAVLLLGGQAQDVTQESAPPDAGTTTPGESNDADAGAASPSASSQSAGPTLPVEPSAVASGLNVAVVPIEGMIYGFTLETLKRRVDEAIDRGADVIVLEIDTLGGLITTAREISQYINNEIKVPTIAWVHYDAISAGAMIATACDEIIMSSSSAIGDAAPIQVGVSNMGSTERSKILSVVLELFRDNATSNNYDYALLEAMCTHGPEVYLVEHTQTGQRKAVNQIDKAIMVDGDNPDSVLARIKQGLDNLFKGGHYHEPAQFAATDKDVGQWKVVTDIAGVRFPDGLVHNGKSLLTLSGSRAVAVGLALTHTIGNDADLTTYLNANTVFRVNQHWSEIVAWVLTLPAVRALLVLVFMVCAFVELQAPGIGWAGGIAVVALTCLIGAPFLIGLAKVWHLLLVLLGVGLILVEIFVTPGFGVTGISGLVAILAGIVLAVVPTVGGGSFALPGRESMAMLQSSALWTLLGLFMGSIACYFVVRHFGQIPGLNRLILRNPAPAGSAAAPVSGGEAIGSGLVAVGDTGRVVADCRPTGQAKLGEHVVDVVTFGAFLEAGQRIQVVEVHGNRIVVDVAG